MSADIYLKAFVDGAMALLIIAHMPFANVQTCIAMLREVERQGHFTFGEVA